METHHKIIIVILIILCLFNCRNNEKKEETSNGKLKKDTEQKRKEYEKLDSLAKDFVRNNNIDSALYYSKKLIKQSYKLKDSTYIAHAFYQVGLNNKRINNIDSAYFYYSISASILKKINDSVRLGNRLLSIAKIESENELYYKSDSTAISALKFLKKRKGKTLVSLYNCLGINARNQKEYDKAKNWYQKAVNNVDDPIRKIRYINNYANYYKHIGEYEKSKELYHTIFKNNYYDSINVKLKAKIIDNYSHARFLNKEDIGTGSFLLAQKLKSDINDEIGLITNYSYLSDFYFKKNRGKSLKFAKMMYSLSKKIKAPEDRLKSLRKISYLCDLKHVRKYREEEDFLRDSINTAKRQSRNKLVSVIYNYEEEKKQKLEARAGLAESNLSLEQQKSQKQLLGFAVILTILSSIVYFFYKREKTKKEKAIEVYNTETRLAKKIHDELANDVYAVMNTLQNSSTTDARLLTRVEKIYTQTRDISHENSPVLTGEHFESFLKQLFLDFTNNTCKVIHKGLLEVNVNELPKEKQIVVYRVLQELLVNMKKYSKASLVLITFSLHKNTMHIAYQDNGIGAEHIKMKNGLQNMETRIESVGGFITFESKQEKGFQAQFQFKK